MTQLFDILDLKSKTAMLAEARSSAAQARSSAKQGRAVMLFTIITVIFVSSHCAITKLDAYHNHKSSASPLVLYIIFWSKRR
jgi:hypothetical protein